MPHVYPVDGNPIVPAESAGKDIPSFLDNVPPPPSPPVPSTRAASGDGVPG